MFIAKDSNTGKIVHIDDVKKEDSTEFLCPICGGEVVKKMGNIVVHHFAHKSLVECDTFTQDMSEWHKWWQNQFPKGNQEHIETLTIKREDFEFAAIHRNFNSNKIIDFLHKHQDEDELIIKHRADVRACGYIIEFQHSPISREEFNERNWFYRNCGCKVVWIFDMTQQGDDKLYWYEEWHKYGKSGSKWKWDHAPKTFSDFLPQYYKKGKDFKGDFKDSSILLFFQFAEYDEKEPDNGIIEQVIWAIEDDYGDANFKRFMTDYEISTPKEFYNAIVNKKL